MIVKVIPAKPAGTGRPLNTYILAAKHERPGERLGPYIEDPGRDRIAWSRTVNSGVENPLEAIGAIERYNAQNTRTHRLSRWVHVIVSFAENEHPSRKQLEIVEDRLMASIGFRDHPRISAGHNDTNHQHLHIAVSRIDPTTFKALHPRHNHFKLQAEAARLELDLGLRQERKTVLSRERREIDSRIALELAHRHLHTGGSDMADLDTQTTTIEFTREELSALANTHSYAAQHYGPHLTPTDGVSQKLATAQNSPVVAIELTRSELFAVMLDHEIVNREITPLQPEVQQRIHEKLLEGERHILSQEREHLQQQPQQERQERAAATISQDRSESSRDKLWDRYTAERETASAARKSAEQEVYDRFASYQQQLRGFYTVQHEQQKLTVQRGPERHKGHELLKAEHRGDRVEARRQQSQQLAAARAQHPVLSWDAFLERESQRGDRDAGRMLQQRRGQEKQQGLER